MIKYWRTNQEMQRLDAKYLIEKLAATSSLLEYTGSEIFELHFWRHFHDIIRA